jgi:hypothetical protein
VLLDMEKEIDPNKLHWTDGAYGNLIIGYTTEGRKICLQLFEERSDGLMVVSGWERIETFEAPFKHLSPFVKENPFSKHFSLPYRPPKTDTIQKPDDERIEHPAQFNKRPASPQISTHPPSKRRQVGEEKEKEIRRHFLNTGECDKENIDIIAHLIYRMQKRPARVPTDVIQEMVRWIEGPHVATRICWTWACYLCEIGREPPFVKAQNEAEMARRRTIVEQRAEQPIPFDGTDDLWYDEDQYCRSCLDPIDWHEYRLEYCKPCSQEIPFPGYRDMSTQTSPLLGAFSMPDEKRRGPERNILHQPLPLRQRLPSLVEDTEIRENA